MRLGLASSALAVRRLGWLLLRAASVQPMQFVPSRATTLHRGTLFHSKIARHVTDCWSSLFSISISRLQVTSKPDLYPLVFSCNADNGKNGSSYLMVQYFRNYIVRPTGSLSATSTVDSLSSSFICNANEANTLVPPPYSRAASPDLPLTIQEYSSMPRSASQQGCSLEQIRMHRLQRTMHSFASNGSGNDIEHVPFYRHPCGGGSTQDVDMRAADDGSAYDIANIGNAEAQRLHCNSANELDSVLGRRMAAGNCDQNNINQLMTLNASHSDQPFRYVINKSPSSLSEANRRDVISSAQAAASDTNATIESEGARREHKQPPQTHSLLSGHFSEESPVNADALKKYGSMRSYINSITGSAVSSLANIGSPGSPPQATSPTGEVKELLEQIRQLQQSTSSQDDLGDANSTNRRQDAASNDSADAYDGDESSASNGAVNAMQSTKKRPSTLQQNRRLSNRTRLFPMSAARNLRSPIGGGASLLGFGRGRKGWISKSAPSTPGTAMPSCFLDDDSPLLLNEHDEDAEQNTWFQPEATWTKQCSEIFVSFHFVPFGRAIRNDCESWGRSQLARLWHFISFTFLNTEWERHYSFDSCFRFASVSKLLIYNSLIGVLGSGSSFTLPRTKARSENSRTVSPPTRLLRLRDGRRWRRCVVLADRFHRLICLPSGFGKASSYICACAFTDIYLARNVPSRAMLFSIYGKVGDLNLERRGNLCVVIARNGSEKCSSV